MSNVSDTNNGVINPDELYTLRTFKKRLSVSDHTLRAARRNGLQVLYLHKQGYILGKDWIDYVLKSSRHSQSDEPASVSS